MTFAEIACESFMRHFGDLPLVRKLDALEQLIYEGIISRETARLVLERLATPPVPAPRP